jgi:hypothetical protein
VRYAVAMWHELTGGDARLMSDVGPIESTIVGEIRAAHCQERAQCRVVAQPLGRRVLLSRTLLGTLQEGIAASKSSQFGDDLIVVHVDHVGDGGSAEWVYRLLPARWRDADPTDDVDTDLIIGIWPD